MKLPIKAKPKSLAIYDYTESEPFVENKRAVLIHRVRYLSEHKISDKWPGHLAVQAWCGTSFTGQPKKFTFLDAPPEGKLLCERCEVAAFAANQPTAESIVGRHVHLGKVVAQQTCCTKGVDDAKAKRTTPQPTALLEAAEKAADWMESVRASGDAGFWDWSEDSEYIKLRAAIEAHRNAQQK